MNRKGQVLVAFLLFLPVIILLFGMLYEIGNIGLEKRRIERLIKETITYGLKNQEDSDIEQKMDNLLVNHIKNIQSKSINITSDTISIVVTVKVNSNFYKLWNQRLNQVHLKYSGTINQGRIKIKEW